MASNNGKKSYVCPYCGAPGFKRTKLKQHVKVMHDDQFKDFLKEFKDLR